MELAVKLNEKGGGGGGQTILFVTVFILWNISEALDCKEM